MTPPGSMSATPVIWVPWWGGMPTASPVPLSLGVKPSVCVPTRAAATSTVAQTSGIYGVGLYSPTPGLPSPWVWPRPMVTRVSPARDTSRPLTGRRGRAFRSLIRLPLTGIRSLIPPCTPISIWPGRTSPIWPWSNTSPFTPVSIPRSEKTASPPVSPWPYPELHWTSPTQFFPNSVNIPHWPQCSVRTGLSSGRPASPLPQNKQTPPKPSCAMGFGGVLGLPENLT